MEQFLGTRRRPTPPRTWGRFASLSLSDQSAIVHSWNGQSEFIVGASRDGITPCDETKMLKYAMGRLNLICDSTMLATIESDDVVEIFSADYVQVYRSFNCYALCNYSLAELGAYPFFELYERSSVVVKQLMEMGESLLAGKSSYISLKNFPEYTLRELMTEEQEMFSMRERCLIKVISASTGASYIVSAKKITPLGPSRIKSGASVAYI